jgi:F0F1-type ATP synthase delta subunit
MAKISNAELAIFAVDQLESGVETIIVAQKLAAYLLEERRSREMPAILRSIDEELHRRGSSQIIITAAHETDIETKKQLAQVLGVENPIFSEVIDRTVIGGVKARSGETEIDLTVRGRLNRFKTNIVSSGK